MEFQFESIGPTLNFVVLAFLFVFALGALTTLVAIASLPGWIARRREHPQAAAVTIAGWLGLPTGIIWLLAMIWAYCRTPVKNLGSLDTQSAINRNLLEQLDRLEKGIETLEQKAHGSAS